MRQLIVAAPAELHVGSGSRAERLASSKSGPQFPSQPTLIVGAATSQSGQELTSQLAAILRAQSEMVPIASGMLPTWQCAWAFSCAVKIRAVIDRALDNKCI